MTIRNKNIDMLKAFAAIGVVIIHTKLFYGINGVYEFLYHLLQTISRIAVPIFFFLNGYYFHRGYYKNKNKYYKEFCIKIIKMHIIAGIIYKLYLTLEKYRDSGNITFKYFKLDNLLKEFLYGGFYYHLWYLPATVLGITVLIIFLKYKKENLLLILAVFLYVFGTIFNQIANNKNIPIEYSRNGVFFGLVFIVMGYLYEKNKNLIKKHINIKSVYLLLGIMGLLILERVIVYKFIGKNENDMYIMLLPLTYLVVNFVMENNIKEIKFISKLGENSGGIYLYHVLIMFIGWKILYYIKVEKTAIFYNIFILIFSYIGAYCFYICFNRGIQEVKKLVLKIKFKGEQNE